ncbi:hypothetical protein [Ferruginibacter sp. SUN106]|uniref:hypothetical protein n=1 Tax=Ferruginibacter sp. SUN106 TaxID=2978348 RepID=UPI003D369F14
MKYLQITKQFAALGLAAMLFSACDKVETTAPLGDAGQNLVTILQGATPYNIIKDPVDFVATPTTLTKGVIDIRREVPTAAALNQTMTVTIKDDTAAVRAANPAYIQFPTSLYTLTLSNGVTKVGGQGGTFTVVFKPGEFAKQIYINVPNATLLNPSALYALGFTITTADAGGKIATAKAVVVEVGAKNNWDGLYEMHGTFNDVSNTAFTYYGDQEYALVTVGATTCDVVNVDLNTGYPGYLFLNAGSGTYYGSYGLVISFNPSNNTISDLHNYYGDPSKAATAGGTPSSGTGAPLYAASNTRRAVLDPTGANAAQGNKDILIKHWLVQPSVITASPNIRTYFDEKWTYLGPR